MLHIRRFGDLHGAADPRGTHSKLVTDLNYSTYLHSRQSFDAAVRPEVVCHDLVTPVCGDGVDSSVFKAISQLKEANGLISQNDTSFNLPVPDMLLKHYASSDPPPEWWSKVRENYLGAMNDMYRANSRLQFVGGPPRPGRPGRLRSAARRARVGRLRRAHHPDSPR